MKKKIESIKESLLRKTSPQRRIEYDLEYREINNVSFEQNFRYLVGHCKGESVHPRNLIPLNAPIAF